MEPAAPRRSPFYRFFSRSSNAFITAAATIVAAVISVYGVRQHERNVAEAKTSQLEQELADTKRQLAAALRSLDGTTETKLNVSGPESTLQSANSEIGPAVTTRKLPHPKSASVDHFAVRVDSVYRNSSGVTVEFDVLNASHRTEQLILFGNARGFGYSRALADGQEYVASSVRFGVDEQEDRVEKQVAGTTKLRGAIKFADVAPAIKSIDVLEVAYSYNSFTARGIFSFRDLEIVK